MDNDFGLGIDAFENDLDVIEIIEVGFPRQILDRIDLFHLYDDLSFFRRFRLTKETVLYLLPRIEQHLEFPYDIHMAIISDVCKISTSSVCRIVKQVSEAIARLAPQVIKFPRDHAAVQNAKNSFYEIVSFPKVIGAIDCTHIRIQSLGGDNAEVFRNRKNYFSINVQVISSAKNEIIDLVARWPGSAHDVTIFNNSNKRREFENNIHTDSFLLGDSAYSLREFLLTPLPDPANYAEQLYNESHIRSRGVVERLFGIWKRRFPILADGSRLKLENTLTVIVASGVLHFIARRMNEAEPPIPEEINRHELQHLIGDGSIPSVPQANQIQFLGPQMRHNLIQDYFAGL